MPKREPEFKKYPGWRESKSLMIAVGATHPSEPVHGTVKGQNLDGYDEAVLVTPGGHYPGTIEMLQMSKVADCAVRLRDNLLNRPNKLSRVGGPLQAKEVTWVLCQQDGWFFKPIAAEIGGEPVPDELLSTIWEHVRES